MKDQYNFVLSTRHSGKTFITNKTILMFLGFIKDYCTSKDDKCTNCPFNMSGAWFDYCMFMSNVPHEGRSPDDWELDKINFDKLH